MEILMMALATVIAMCGLVGMIEAFDRLGDADGAMRGMCDRTTRDVFVWTSAVAFVCGVALYILLAWLG